MIPDSNDFSPHPPPANSSDHGWAAACHLASFVSLVGIPFGHILGPLVVWLIKKGDSVLVDDQGKESLNFQISMTLYGAVLVAAGVLLFFMGIFGAAQGGAGGMLVLLTLPGVLMVVIAYFVLDLVLTLVAAVNAGSGKYYRYPFTIRFL